MFSDDVKTGYHVTGAACVTYIHTFVLKRTWKQSNGCGETKEQVDFAMFMFGFGKQCKF